MRWPRCRSLKWSGLIVSVLLLALTVASVWWAAAWSWPQLVVGIEGGAFIVVRDERPRPGDELGGQLWGPERQPLDLWFEHNASSTRTEYAAPLWIPFVLIGTATAVLWWRDRGGRKPGACRRCGYDLTGLASGALCPECGKGGTGANP